MQDQLLPKGFISVDDAIKLIESDTRQNPVVDIDRMIRNFTYIEVDHNFNIFLLDRDKDGKIIKIGETPTHFFNNYDVERFKHALTSHYRELSGREFEENITRSLSTTIDDANPAGHIVKQEKPMTQSGEFLGSGNPSLSE